MAEASAPAPGLVIDQETLDHLPAFHKAIAEGAHRERALAVSRQ